MAMNAEEASVIADVKAGMRSLEDDISRLAEIDPEAKNAVAVALAKLRDLEWWLGNGVFPSEVGLDQKGQP